MRPTDKARVRRECRPSNDPDGAAPALRPVARLVRASHERWDGSGYPDGLRATEIPLGSRVVAVCDAYEVAGRELAVIGSGACAAGEALFLTTYSRRVTLVTLGGPADITPQAFARLQAAGVAIVAEPVEEIAAAADGVRIRLPERALRTESRIGTEAAALLVGPRREACAANAASGLVDPQPRSARRFCRSA